MVGAFQCEMSAFRCVFYSLSVVSSRVFSFLARRLRLVGLCRVGSGAGVLQDLAGESTVSLKLFALEVEKQELYIASGPVR